MKQYPLDLFSVDEKGNYSPFIVFQSFKVEFNKNNALDWAKGETPKEPIDSFSLYMPNGGLFDAQSHKWSSEQSLVAGLFNEGVRNIDSKLFNGGVEKLANHAGIILDPKLTQLYKGSSERRWSATWSILPQNKSEADEVMQIFKNIKQWSAPSKYMDLKNKIGLLKQPYIWNITFSNPILQEQMTLNDMVLESYNINYFANGSPSTFKDMMPKQMELSMNFVEFGMKTQEDWE